MSRNQDVKERGGADQERLYLENFTFAMKDGMQARVVATDIPGINMEDLIARHRARYFLVGVFCRPHHKVLDFPCGSGYGAEVLRPFKVEYEGLDIDEVTIEYAEQIYGRYGGRFGIGDLCRPRLAMERYDVIGCVEGLEHIELHFQDQLIEAFARALKPGGVLVISTPEAIGRSGPSSDNPHHLGELTNADFDRLVGSRFRLVEKLTHSAVLSTGRRATLLYRVCHK